MIEDEVFVGHGVMFINDRLPRAATGGRVQTDGDWELLPTRVMQGASLGSGAVILGGVTIGRNAMVGAGAVVTKNVPDDKHRRRGTGPALAPPAPAGTAAVISVGIIGYGYWGPTSPATSRRSTRPPSVRSATFPSTVSVWCGAVSPAAAPADYRDILNDPGIDAVAVATPVSSHYAITMEALAPARRAGDQAHGRQLAAGPGDDRGSPPPRGWFSWSITPSATWERCAVSAS